MSPAAPCAQENPFRITPNPRFVYSGQLDAAREGLRAAVSGGDDGAVLGEPGMGKTLLLRLLAEDCKGADVRFAAAGPGFDPRPLFAPAEGERSLLILLDDAHALSARELRQIWDETRARRQSGGLASLILAGRPRLEPAAAEAELALHWFCLARLGETEIPELICRRLAEAGMPQDAFSPEALAEIARRSRGVPRLVNLLCSNALFRSQSEGAAQVSQECATHAAEALDLPAPPPEPPAPPPPEVTSPSTVVGVAGIALEGASKRPRLGWRALASGVGLFLGGLTGLLLMTASGQPSPPAMAPAEAAMPVPVASAPPEGPPNVRVFYSIYDAGGARAARRVAAALSEHGFKVSGVSPVRAPISSTSIRYFFDADADAGAQAKRVASRALQRGGAASPRISDLTHYEPKPAEGALEVWIGDVRGAARSSTRRPASDVFRTLEISSP